MSANLAIRLLGGLEFCYGGRPITGFVSNKVPALLAYLVTSGRPHRREHLAGLLWGELPDDAAANNLRQALTNLRKQFEPHLLITRETVAFDRTTDHFLDTEHFVHTLRLSSDEPVDRRVELLRQALALYQGDFLEGFHVRDAPDFEDWALVQRVRLRELALQGWDALTTLLLESGDYTGASETAAALLAMDPWREEAHRQRMLALARSGQHSAALAQYQRCRAILRKEFDAEPAAETTALYQRIRAAQHGPRHNLPAVTTAFVGRRAELAELRRLLAAPQPRLITILGPGGVGKSRLALEVATACAPMFLNGVWFHSPMAAEPAGLEQLFWSLADLLGCQLRNGDEPGKQLLAFLRQKELLLVLDNVEEHPEAALWLSQLLAQAPAVKLLVTSRHRLDLQAEHLFPLEGLPLPAGEVADPEASDAVQLFVHRARHLRADFALAGAEGAAALRICRLVAGLPLGIELAAAWSHQLTCAQIAAEIEQGLDFLTTTRRDVAPRQRSLRATFDWSWGRLTGEEQTLFARLSVFAGPFSWEAAQTVGARRSLLFALVDKSLVWRRGECYQLHDVARQFSAEKLRQAGEEQELLARHAHYYAHFLAQQQPRFEGREQQAALAAVEGQIDNVRAAWHWLVTAKDVAGMAAALASLYYFLAIRSRFREGVALFNLARLTVQPLAATDPAAHQLYSRAMAREGRFLAFLSRYAEAKALLAESLAIFRMLGDKDEMAFALNHLGGTARIEGDLALAGEQLQECLLLRRETGNGYGQAIALLELAGVAFMAGDYERTRTHCAEGLAVAESAGDSQTIAHLLTGLSLSYRELGQFEEARVYGRRSQAIYQELGDRYGEIQAALTLGELSRQLGECDGARRFCAQAVQLSQEIGHHSGEADGYYRLGQIAADQGEWGEALGQFRQALSLAHEIQESPLVLDALLEIGCLLVELNSRQPALAILGFLHGQPQTSAQRRARICAALARLGDVTGCPVAGASLSEMVRLATVAE